MTAHRRLPRALVFLLALAWGSAFAQPPAADTALDGLRLAALAQRIAKLHVQAGQGVLAERSRKALASAVRDFDRQLAALGPSARPESRDDALLLQLLWKDYRAWALRAPRREQARQVCERADEVAWVASRAAARHAAHAPAHGARDAARAAMATHRLSRDWLMRRWGEGAGHVDGARASIEAALAGARTLAGSDPEAAADVDMAQSQWAFLVAALGDTGAPAARQAETVAKASDHVAEILERIARRGAP